MADDPILRIQVEEVAKPNLPPSSAPIPQTPPQPVSNTQGQTFAGLPAPEPYFTAEEAPNVPRFDSRADALPPPLPSSPEKPPANAWKPGEDPVLDVVRELAGRFVDLDVALGHLQDTVEATERTWDSIPLPFTENVTTDEADFNANGLNLSRPMEKGDDFKLPPIMPPGYRPPVDAEAVDEPDYSQPPRIADPVQPPPINPWHSRRSFALAAQERLGGAMAGLGQQLPGIVGSGVGAGVGAATGSPTLGALAGSAAGVGAAMLPMAVAIPLATVGIAATAVTESFKALRSTTNQLAASIVGINGAATAASARAEIQQLENKLYTSREIGDTLAQNIEIESQLDAALNRFNVELVREFGPLVNGVLSGVTEIIDLITELKKANGGLWGHLLDGPFGVGALARIAKWWQGEEQKKNNPIDQAVLDFLDPSKVADIPHGRERKRANTRRPGGIF